MGQKRKRIRQKERQHQAEEQERRYIKVGSNWQPWDSRQGGDIRIAGLPSVDLWSLRESLHNSSDHGWPYTPAGQTRIITQTPTSFHASQKATDICTGNVKTTISYHTLMSSFYAHKWNLKHTKRERNSAQQRKRSDIEQQSAIKKTEMNWKIIVINTELIMNIIWSWSWLPKTMHTKKKRDRTG